MRHKLTKKMESVKLSDVVLLPLSENAIKKIETIQKNYGKDLFLRNVWPVFSSSVRREMLKNAD